MKIIKVEASFERTVNIGNFQNMKPSAHIVIQVEEGEDVKEVYKEAFKIVSSEVNARAKAIDEFFNGKK